MKKGLVILSLVAGIGFSAYALFKLLTEKNGTITQSDSEQTPAETGSEKEERSQEA